MECEKSGLSLYSQIPMVLCYNLPVRCLLILLWICSVSVYADTKVTDAYGKTSYTPALSSIHAIVHEAADLYRLDPLLVKTVISVESDFNPRVVSKKGAKGLMQLMPNTAKNMGVEDIFDPRENIYGGCKYLRSLINRYRGNLTLALAAYNAGPSAVARHGGIPPYRETINYVNTIMKRYRGYGIKRGIKSYRDKHNRLVITNMPSGKR